MSTLTKVLIVLQVVFSILLCGVVVSYVATADNYYSQWKDEKDDKQRAVNNEKKMAQEWDKFKEANTLALDEAKEQLAALIAEKGDLQDQIAALELDKLNLTKDIDKWASSANAASKSSQQQTTLFEQTNAELKELKLAYSQLERQYKEIDDSLIEKLAIIDQQNTHIRTLTEEKADLRGQLESQNRQYGLNAPKTTPVTAYSGPQMAMTAPALDLKGTVTAVDLGEKLAQISIGSNHGVREQMTFHVTRGNQYVCDIQVIAVDSNRSVGVIGMGQGNPQSGDLIATNL